MRNRFILTPFVLDEASPELESLAQSDWFTNKPGLPDGDKQQRMSGLHKPIAEFVATTIVQGGRPVSISGDCCTTLGVLAGLQKAKVNPVLLWLDAHGDFNTWETTPSGFVGGMPLAMLVGRGEQTMPHAIGLEPLPESRVILSDARNLDPKEEQALAQSGVRRVIDTRSLPDHLPPSGPLYIHLDTDVINPHDAPAMSYPAAGGPSSSDLRKIFQSLAQTKRIVAISMTTWTPQLDEDGRSREICMELLRVLMGQ